MTEIDQSNLPGIRLNEVNVSWSTPFSKGVWDGAAERGNVVKVRFASSEQPVEKEEDTGPRGFLITAIRDSQPRIAEMVIICETPHLESADNKINWRLTIHRAPKGQPPENVLKLNGKIDGWNGLSAFLNNLSQANGTLPAKHRVLVYLDPSKWSCPLVPRDLQPEETDPLLAKLGRQVHMEQVGYRFEGGVVGIEEISIIYAHEKPNYMVSIIANGVVDPGKNGDFPYVKKLYQISRKIPLHTIGNE